MFTSCVVLGSIAWVGHRSAVVVVGFVVIALVFVVYGVVVVIASVRRDNIIVTRLGVLSRLVTGVSCFAVILLLVLLSVLDVGVELLDLVELLLLLYFLDTIHWQYCSK